MISFELNEEQRIAQASVREFAASILAPEARKADDAAAVAPALLKQLWSLGIVQARAAGEPHAAIMSALLLEELALGDASLAIAVAAPLGFVAAIVEQGSDAQRAALLPLFSDDTYRAAAIALVEPSPAFDNLKLATRATLTSDGYRINGVKSMVPFASSASHFLVIAEVGGLREAFIVEAGAAGLSVEAPYVTLGLAAAQASTIQLKDVVVPASARLGEAKGSDVDRLVDGSRAALAALMTGLCQGVMHYVIPYTQQRVAHGTQLAKKQSVAFKIADMHMRIEAMRWMHWRAAATLDKSSDDATRLCRLAQVYAAQHTMWIADEGLQMLGGHGFTRDYPVEMWYRNARTLSMLEGTVGL
ncbi:MAG: acyl-CoA dehydrogenase family protein [Janthinobacterium lividum]